MSKKLFAVITPSIVGIFDQWFIVKQIIDWTPTFKYMTFSTKREAVGFIRSNLSDEDWEDFCLDRCPLYINKKFVRLKKYIENKEAKNCDLLN